VAYSLEKPCHHEEEIKKSRFLARAFPLARPHDFVPLLTTIKAQENATHHCFAWKCGTDFRFYDDGEPSGTAGRPILAVIEGRNYDQIAIIVSRWYGGVKLGTGGLARAYSGSASRALAKAHLVEIVATVDYQFHVPFALWPRLEKMLTELCAHIENQDFDATGVKLTLTVPQKRAEDLAQRVRNMSRGQIRL